MFLRRLRPVELSRNCRRFTASPSAAESVVDVPIRNLPGHLRNRAAKSDVATGNIFSSIEKRFGRVWNGTYWVMTKRVTVPLPLVLGGGLALMQGYFGTSDNFFDGKFITSKEPDELAEFYQAEDLLKLIAMHPIFFNLFMNKVEPDTRTVKEDTAFLDKDETRFKVNMLGMDVAFEILQEEEEINGETKLTSFQRHERFIDYVPFFSDFGMKILLWDQTWNYGFKRLEDGRYEVFHYGEKFYGPWPIRLIVFFHQYYVLWACEKYINGNAFGTDDLDAKEEQMSFLLLYEFKQYVKSTMADARAWLSPAPKVVKKNPEMVVKTKKEVTWTPPVYSDLNYTGASGKVQFAS
jgi:hypothetical protein